MAAWLSYAAVSAAVLVGLSVVVALLVGSPDAPAVWVAAAVAFPVQLLAFGALVAARRSGSDFVVSWGSGMLLRFAVIAGMAFWVTRRTDLTPAVALLSLVGFVFVLVLLEPPFLRLADDRGSKTGD